MSPALQTCSCPLALSGPGKSFASESFALNSGQLCWQFSQCVTRRTVSLSRGSSSHERLVLGLSTGPLSQAPYWGDYSPTGLSICAVGVGLASGLHYASLLRVPKTQTRSAPMPSHVPAPRQPIPGITLGLRLLRQTPGPLAGGQRAGQLLIPRALGEQIAAHGFERTDRRATGRAAFFSAKLTWSRVNVPKPSFV